MPARLAFMPLGTYPEVIADDTILAAAGFSAALGFELHVRAYSVDIPQVYSPMGGFLLDVPGLFLAAEEKSKAECLRVKALLEGSTEKRASLEFSSRQVQVGAVLDIATAEARYYDLLVLPWSDGTVLAQDMAEAVVFGSGRPAILVPPSARPASIDHIAIAWDASRVAARALGDALSLLPAGGRVSVLTVQDEKPLSGSDVAGSLASSLERRGFKAKPYSITIGGKTIAEALQEAALAEGAQLLAMGGFGHSRMRDFVLGGATKGVLADLRLPTLLSH
ncbi:MAG: universal stress protein [Labrys sp. (in: a-proteobacteria)]